MFHTNIRKLSTTVVAAVAITLAGAPAATGVEPGHDGAAPPAVQGNSQMKIGPRIAGDGPYATSALMAEQYGAADAVIIANGEVAGDGADALAASYLAGQVGAPIILTPGDALPPVSLSAIKRTLDRRHATIYLMGQTGAISTRIARQLATEYPNAKQIRIGESDRYGTAAKTALTPSGGAGGVAIDGGPLLPTAILANGLTVADAIAAGPLAAAWGIPVLLTGNGALPAVTADAIEQLKVKQLIVLGGEGRVTPDAIADAKAAGVNHILRVAGTNRFATSVALYQAAQTRMRNRQGRNYGHAGSGVFLSNGLTGFVSALAAAPVAGLTESYLLTTSEKKLAGPVAGFLHDTELPITALGSTTQLPERVVAKAVAAAAGAAPPTNETRDPVLRTLYSYLPDGSSGVTIMFDKEHRCNFPHDATTGGCVSSRTPNIIRMGGINLDRPGQWLRSLVLHEYSHVLQFRWMGLPGLGNIARVQGGLAIGLEKTADCMALTMGATGSPGGYATKDQCVGNIAAFANAVLSGTDLPGSAIHH